MRYDGQSTRYGSSGATKARVHLDVDRGAEVLGPLIVGEIKLAVAAGKDASGAPFRAYSPGYAEAKQKAGRNVAHVDLNLTGGLMASIDVRRTQKTVDSVTLDIGPDASSSPAVTLTDNGARRTGKSGPPHNIVGLYLQRMGFNWLGISREARQRIVSVLRASKILIGER